jgi:hypothetical protein
LKNARYALWKNPDALTVDQAHRLAWIAKTDPRQHRAYLLKEGLRHVFAVKGQAGKEALDRWLSWARRCRIPAFVALGRKIAHYHPAIDAALDHDLSNGLVESTNTKIRLLTRIAFGFRSPQALIALAIAATNPNYPDDSPTHESREPILGGLSLMTIVLRWVARVSTSQPAELRQERVPLRRGRPRQGHPARPNAPASWSRSGAFGCAVASSLPGGRLTGC